MRLKTLRIKNYRSFLCGEVDFDPLTAIVGPNGAGKSTVLHALAEFYSTTRSVTIDDYYNRDNLTSIEIGITFSDITPREIELFGDYVHDGELAITKVIDQNGERYHGTRFANPEFASFQRASSKSDKKKIYAELRKSELFQDLPSIRSSDEAKDALSVWEQAHPDSLELMLDDGKFFGFRQVGQARLERFTRFVLVPAVKDAGDDAADSRGSAIFQLMELVVRSTLQRSTAFLQFRAKTQEDYAKLLDPAEVPQLGKLAAQLTEILKSYVNSAAVLLDWVAPDQLQLPLPKAAVRLREDNFEAPVDRVGHGLQRAFILSLLQGLAGTLHEQPDHAESDGEGDRLD